MYSYKSQAKVGGGRGGPAGRTQRLGPRRQRQRRFRRARPMRPRGPPLPPAAPVGPPAAAQGIFKKMAGSSSRPPPRMSIESGAFTFHYLIDGGDVCYLTLAEKAYPKKLAFQYLEELQSEFGRLYGEQIEGVTRPYAFIKFGAQRAAARRRRGACAAAAAVRSGRWPAGGPRRPAAPPPPRRRHVHPEDQEAVPGHAHAAQPGQAEPGHCRGARGHDAQHRRRAGPGRAPGP